MVFHLFCLPGTSFCPPWPPLRGDFPPLCRLWRCYSVPRRFRTPSVLEEWMPKWWLAIWFTSNYHGYHGYLMWSNKIYRKFTVNYNNSPTWINAIWGWFPLLTMIPVRSQWGHYNLPRYISYYFIPSVTLQIAFQRACSHMFHDFTASLLVYFRYPLVNVYITMENHHFIAGKIHYFYGHVQ